MMCIDWATIADFLVGFGTLALAAATFWIAKATKDVAVAGKDTAVATRDAAVATKEAALGELLNILLADWSSDKIAGSADEIGQWIRHGAQSTDAHALKRLESHRRPVSSYFQRVHTLWTKKFIDERVVQAAVTKVQAELYIAMEPLEAMHAATINKSYDTSSFEYFSKLYGIPRSHPSGTRT